MDWGEILLSLLFNLVVTVLFYLLVPVIFCLCRKSLTKKQIRTIVIINGIVVWLIFQILTLELTGEAGTGAAVFLWSAVAYGLLRRNCLVVVEEKDKEKFPAEPNIAVENTPVEDSKTIEPEKIAEISLSPKGEIQKKYGNYNISGSDVRFNPEVSHSTPKNKTAQSESVPQKARLYCSRCGGEIESDTAKCTQCGKQYLNKLTKIGIAIIAAAVLIIIVIICIAVSAINDNATETTSGNTPTFTPIDGNIGFGKWSEAKFISEYLEGTDSDYFDYMVQAYKISQNENVTYDQRKNNVVSYINDLPIDYGEKIILFRWIYQSDSTYCSDIVDYLNERADVSYDNTVWILEHLGFTVDTDGTVHWD